MTPTLEQLHRALGGQICGGKQLSCPGPGHSARDRSLSILIDANAPDGFVLHSHAGDDWQDCRNYVRQLLGRRAKNGKPAVFRAGTERGFLDSP
jgi:putative DNA primase/helicase